MAIPWVVIPRPKPLPWSQVRAEMIASLQAQRATLWADYKSALRNGKLDEARQMRVRHGLVLAQLRGRLFQAP